MALKPSENEVQRFASDLKSAFELRRQFYQVEMDREFEAEGGTILYAVDSNVLYQHFQTFATATRAAAKTRYSCGAFDGPIHRPEEQEDKAKITQVVVSYLVRALSSVHSKSIVRSVEPLLLLPGHAGEAKSVYDALISQFFGQKNRKRETKNYIEALLDKIEKIADPKKRIKYIEDHEDAFHSALFGLEEPHDKFQEFNRLLGLPRLLNMARAAATPELKGLKNPESKKSVFEDFALSDQLVSSEGSAAWWELNLGKKKPEPYIEADKAALSALDRINRNLRGQNVRVVLLTMGEDIIELGRQYKPYKHADAKIGRFSFSDLYIRHPRCYLSRPDIFLPTQGDNKSSDITAWLDAMLSDISEKGHRSLLEFIAISERFVGNQIAIKEVSKRALTRNPEIHSEFYSNWTDYVSNVVLAHSGVTREARRSLELALKNKDMSRLDVLDEFETYVTQLTDESWNDFFFTAARSGYQLIGIANTSRVRKSRSVPPMILRNMGSGSDLISYLASENGVVRYEAQIQDILDRLVESRVPSDGYVSSVCFASLFAHGSRWSVTKLMAQRAIGIAERIKATKKDKKGHLVTGREAHFICAVAHRMTARSAKELDVCDYHIKKAKEKLNDEVGERKEREDLCSAPGLTGLRFDAESVAIDMSRLYFKVQSGGWTFDAKDGFESEHCKIIERIKLLLAGSKECSQDFIRKWSCNSLRGSAFSCVFLMEKYGFLDEKTKDTVKSWLDEHIKDMTDLFYDKKNQWSVSALDIYLVLYMASFGVKVDPLLVAIRSAYTAIQAEHRGSQPYALMPFDKKRFRLLAELIDSR